MTTQKINTPEIVTENLKKFTFKTNINCGGCLAKVGPVLDGANGIQKWDVDTNTADKILTIVSDGISIQEVIDLVQNAGYRIELINN